MFTTLTEYCVGVVPVKNKSLSTRFVVSVCPELSSVHFNHKNSPRILDTEKYNKNYIATCT